LPLSGTQAERTSNTATAENGRQVGGSMGGSVGRAIVRGMLGAILHS
jgi:hypothetical protein